MIPPEALGSVWYATSDHPEGAAPSPHFQVIGAFVYPSCGHPSGPSPRPWYQLRGSLAFAIDGHPDGPSSEPSFRVVDDGVQPHSGDPDTAVAWFRVAAAPPRQL